MIDYIKDISIYLLFGFFVTMLSVYLESSFLLNFLTGNLVLLLVTLLAINTATLGLLSNKIKDVYLIHKTADFTLTTNEMRKSLIEQVVLIIISVIVLIFNSSKIIQIDIKDIITGTLLSAIMIFDIYILWDTGNAVFVLLDEIKNLNKTSN